MKKIEWKKRAESLAKDNIKVITDNVSLKIKNKELIKRVEDNKSKPNKELLISKVKQNLQGINIDKKITDYNFDFGYSLGFLDGNDFSRQIPELTLDQAIEKAKPNMDKIKDVDAHLNEIK